MVLLEGKTSVQSVRMESDKLVRLCTQGCTHWFVWEVGVNSLRDPLSLNLSPPSSCLLVIDQDIVLEG